MRYRSILILSALPVLLIAILLSSPFISLRKGEYAHGGACRTDIDCYTVSDCNCGYRCVDQTVTRDTCPHSTFCPFAPPRPDCYCVQGRCTALHPSEEPPQGRSGQRYQYALRTLRSTPTLCEHDEDCINTCDHGAVNREWARDHPDGCEDGCAGSHMGNPRCVNDSCTAFRKDGSREPGCTHGTGDCITEGERVPPSHDKGCCGRLREIAVCDDEGNNCRHTICADCGDGTCEAWESPHTCEADCDFEREHIHYCRDGHCATKTTSMDLPLKEASQARQALRIYGINHTSLTPSACTLSPPNASMNVSDGDPCWRYTRSPGTHTTHSAASYYVYGEVSSSGIINEEWRLP